MAFTYYSPYAIQSGQVPSTQTDFPVLVSVTDARLKSVGNGGHVQSSSGFDIRPYSDSGITTAITGYELERYIASTGELEMWVKVGSLSSSTTPIYLAYGNTSLTTDGSSTTTWSNSFISVYHLKDGTTLSVADSLAAHNGTNSGGTAATGQIDGGLGLVSASSQNVDLGTGIDPAALTYSAWLKGTTFPNDYNGVITKGSGGVDATAFFVKSNGKLMQTVNASGGTRVYDGSGSHTLSTGTWYLVHLTYDSTAGLIGYVNAASDATVSPLSTLTASPTAHTAIGLQQSTGTRFFNGTIDECRISSVARPANWITTEYNNQSAPGTFAVLGTEVPIAGAGVNSGFLMFM